MDTYLKSIEELFAKFEYNVFRRGMGSTECEKTLQNNEVIIYGGGNSGVVMYERLIKAGIHITAFIDNGGSIYGKEYCGVPIFNNQEMLTHLEEDKKYVCLITILDILDYWNIKSEIEKQLNVYSNFKVYYFTQFRAFDKIFGINKKPELSAYVGEDVGILLKNKDKIMHVYNLLADIESKKIYMELLNYYIGTDFVSFTVLPFIQHYFAYDLYKKIEDEVFIDCGAYNGDTLDVFRKNQKDLYKKYIAIEADERNYKKLLNKIENQDIINVEVLQRCIASKKKIINFTNNGTTYSKEENGINGKQMITVTLDELCYQYKPTFIKINIEGADVEAIIGAEKIIKEYTPVIAAQGHHRVEHLWEIVNKIEEFKQGDYKFFLRNYKGIIEFTFYAIPKRRLKELS